MNQKIYQEYLTMLNEELIPALGCTEPIAIALASAKARETLGSFPEKIQVSCSGNIIKNAMGVIVPTTKDMKGIDTSAVLGCVAGISELGLEVLSNVTPADIKRTRELLKTGICTVDLIETQHRLHIIVEMSGNGHSALAEIMDEHTNITCVMLDGNKVFSKAADEVKIEKKSEADRSLLNVKDILQFASEVKIEDIDALISRQINYNTAISQEGLKNSYGGQVGKTLIKHYGNDIRVYARAAAAAGSDARMGGCVLPVIICSGSGNQGMTASLPVIAYAKHLNKDRELLLRALVVSNLVTFLQKRVIGRLSAYCGAVCAACGSGAAITYLYGGDYDSISRTITNTLANVSGIVCDGAKGSCAAKIATAIDAAILGHEMSMDGNTFGAGEGLVKDDVEKTIASIGKMAADGMRETDTEILKIMIDVAVNC